MPLASAISSIDAAAEPARAEDPLAGVEHPLLALSARKPAAGGCGTGSRTAHARSRSSARWWRLWRL